MGEEIQDANVNDINLMNKRWKNRRRMAWVSLVSMILLTFMIMFTEAIDVERLKVLGDVITWYYFSCASVVGAYMGFTTMASIKGIKG